MEEQKKSGVMHRRGFFKEESLPPRELLVQGVKLTAVILVLWFCQGPAADVVKGIFRYLIGSS
jgi:hypothetical protein